MRKNVGRWDRNTRLIVGTAALLAGLFAPLPKAWKISLLTLGSTELLTGSTRYCPVNQALGLNTNFTGPKDTLRQVAWAVT